MRPRLFGNIAFTFLLAACFTTFVDAQVFEYKDGRKLEIEFVQEPPCPVKISVKNVNLKPEPDAQLITLQIENVSSKPIRAYAMVSGGNQYPNVHTWSSWSAPFEPGKTLTRGVWPNSQEHYYFFFDYILFTDGTTCGNDNHHRSIQIASYMESHAAAVRRLKELAAIYPNPNELVTEFEAASPAGYLSFDKAGPPNPETIRSMPRIAWAHVIAPLYLIEKRGKEAVEIAEKLQKELPR